MKNVVLNAEPAGYSQAAIATWKRKGFRYETSTWTDILKTETFSDVTVLIVRLGRKVDANILDRFPKLEKLVSATTGHDHLDVSELKARKIKLVSLRGHTKFLKTIPSTAEHTWGLLLALIRNVPAANEHVKNGSWDRDQFKGYQLKGKTIGIIGLGRIGMQVANYARAFGMEVLYVDPNVKTPRFKKSTNLRQLLSKSDVITLHVHLSDATAGLINKTNLQYVKPGAFFINTSRGGIVEEEALADLLAPDKNGKPILAGVATDVLTTELEDIRKSALWKAQQKGYNVLITPHIGGASWDAMWMCEEYIVNEL